MSIINVENAHASTKLLAATTLRNVLGTKVLSEILSDRESIAHTMQVSLFDYGHVTLSVYFDLFRARWLRPCHVDFANITCLNYGSLYVSVSFAVNVVAWFDTLSHDLILCHMIWYFVTWYDALTSGTRLCVEWYCLNTLVECFKRTLSYKNTLKYSSNVFHYNNANIGILVSNVKLIFLFKWK